MRREMNPILIQARDNIEARLEVAGFKLQYETLYYDSAFGSATIEYRHRAQWLRLNWDGKDHYLWLSGATSRDQHVWPAADDWHPLDPPSARLKASERLELGPRATARIEEWLAQIELFLRTKAAV